MGLECNWFSDLASNNYQPKLILGSGIDVSSMLNYTHHAKLFDISQYLFTKRAVYINYPDLYIEAFPNHSDKVASHLDKQ